MTMLLCGEDSDTVWGQCYCVVRTVILCGDNPLCSENSDTVWIQCYCVVRAVMLCGDNAAVW